MLPIFLKHFLGARRLHDHVTFRRRKCCPFCPCLGKVLEPSLGYQGKTLSFFQTDIFSLEKSWPRGHCSARKAVSLLVLVAKGPKA